MPRVTGRAFLLPDRQEDPGYGLYSYLLLGAKPDTATKARFAAVLVRYLLLEESSAARGYCTNALNVTYLPLNESPPADIWEARLSVLTVDNPLDSSPLEWVFEHYDYTRAAFLLAKVPGDSAHVVGPYLVSHTLPLGRVARLESEYLWQDLSAVEPRLAGAWMKAFKRQAAKRHYWRSTLGETWALELRNAIASVSSVTAVAAPNLELSELLQKPVVWR